MHGHPPKTRNEFTWTSQRLRKPRKDRKSIKGIGGLWWTSALSYKFSDFFGTKNGMVSKRPANSCIAGKRTGEELKLLD
jgi:hypothetical protein